MIYACVEQKNIISSTELNREGQETTTKLITDTDFTTTVKYLETSINTDLNKDALDISSTKEKHSESEEILEVGKMRVDKKMIYSSAELKIISAGDQDKNLNDHHGDTPVLNSGRTTFGSNLQENSSDDSLLSNLEVSLAINFIATTY